MYTMPYLNYIVNPACEIVMVHVTYSCSNHARALLAAMIRSMSDIHLGSASKYFVGQADS